MDDKLNLGTPKEEDEILKNALEALGVDDDDSNEVESDDQPLSDATDTTESEPQRQLSKEEKAILALKKELKETKKLMKVFEEEKKQQEAQNKKANLISSYKEKGYDDDTAGLYAENELKMKLLEEKFEIQEFREEHYEVLSKYPQARSEIKWLMNAAKSPVGLTVEQICKAKYGDSAPAHERRAKEAVSGMIDDSIEDDKATTAMRTAKAPSTVGLTSAEMKAYKIAKQWNADLTKEQFKAYYNRNT